MNCCCSCIIIPGPTQNIPPYYICSCCCNIHILCKNKCVHEKINEDFYNHKIICEKYDTSEKSYKLGFFGIGLHFGIEIEFEMLCNKDEFDDFLDAFSSSHFTKYFIVSRETSLPFGIEFISAPMNYYYHSFLLVELYDFLRTQKVIFFGSDKTGTHIHLTKQSIYVKIMKEYLSSNEKEIDLFAGRKQNRYCKRDFSSLNTKSNALRETPKTIEIRIFKTFENPFELLNRIKVLENILTIKKVT